MKNNHFTAEDVNKAEADIMQDGNGRGQTHAFATTYDDIFDLDKYADPDPKETTVETIKPSKKIPYYHHKRRF